MQLALIKSPVKDSFEAVDSFLIQCLHSKASLINDLGKYIIESGGKRLRPLVVLLISKACGYQKNEDIKLAAIIELIHTATLLHDDIVDGSVLRRGQKTANTVWGNEAAVLVGDFLYSKAFQILIQVGNLPVMNVLANATNIMAEGEALQLRDRHNANPSEEAYLNIIRCKTAKLFEASAQIAAIIAHAKPEIEAAMMHYGAHLGMAFQLLDDILDYQSTPEQIGKNIGSDLAEGKVTLPLIYLLQTSSTTQIEMIKKAIQTGDTSHLCDIQAMVSASGAIEYAKRFANQEIEQAKQALSILPASPYRDAAEKLANFAIERTH